MDAQRNKKSDTDGRDGTAWMVVKGTKTSLLGISKRTSRVFHRSLTLRRPVWTDDMFECYGEIMISQECILA